MCGFPFFFFFSLHPCASRQQRCSDKGNQVIFLVYSFDWTVPEAADVLWKDTHTPLEEIVIKYRAAAVLTPALMIWYLKHCVPLLVSALVFWKSTTLSVCNTESAALTHTGDCNYSGWWTLFFSLIILLNTTSQVTSVHLLPELKKPLSPSQCDPDDIIWLTFSDHIIQLFFFFFFPGCV